MSTDETIEVDGPRAAAEILCRLPRDTRARLVESIRTLNPQSAVRIESIIVQSLASAASRPTTRTRQADVPTRRVASMPSKPIAAITEIPDTKLQEVLREASPRELAVSLKHAPREAQEKVLSNISSTKQHAVLDELQQLPPMKLTDVEAAQARLLKSVDDAYADDVPTPPSPPRRLRSRLA
jgi:flagellar motor switch protein FliG